ncbi:DUF1109 domain-containing protein [Pseudomonas sp. KNUC1026]|uniref:DUF1109 domain-containing protein n=1 Tax=Pseudomonas sp. KNUC1026 TaxID=2893890 RepID=UPI001F45D749|nr:DUF1109 domain-containing protein [Pseudomonas sp. KNUC1026]UFH51191.1 DUF1109 domain-containing protein [Pseudomonas sp. KNUC1026]
MRTDDLIALLAAESGKVDRHLLARRLALAVMIGVAGAAMLAIALFGIRPDLLDVARTPLFWAKVAFPTALGLGALWFTARLSRPGVDPGVTWCVLALPLLLVLLGGAAALIDAPAEGRTPLVLGQTWRTCPFNIALLSVPGFIANFWALKAMCPTRLRLAGAGAGLLSGAAATLAYCIHCPEMGVPFWGIWYVAGMLIPTLVGAALGPRVLRW